MKLGNKRYIIEDGSQNKHFCLKYDLIKQKTWLFFCWWFIELSFPVISDNQIPVLFYILCRCTSGKQQSFHTCSTTSTSSYSSSSSSSCCYPILSSPHTLRSKPQHTPYLWAPSLWVLRPQASVGVLSAAGVADPGPDGAAGGPAAGAGPLASGAPLPVAAEAGALAEGDGREGGEEGECSHGARDQSPGAPHKPSQRRRL